MQTNQTNELGAELTRLQEDREGRAAWKKWGPYLSERQWGTVREDYSSNGDAWNYFTLDQAQYRAYRWGEDGLAGISDNRLQHQGGQTEKLQEKVAEIVMEKVAEAVQKKAEEVQEKTEPRKRRTSFDNSGGTRTLRDLPRRVHIASRPSQRRDRRGPLRSGDGACHPARHAPLVVHCHLGLGKLYGRTGWREQAHEHLNTAMAMCREMGMVYWLEQAEADMRALA